MRPGHPPARRPSARTDAAAVLLAAASALGGGAVAAGAPAPAPGRYDATLCVVNADAAPNCGPAEADLRPGGTLRARVSDIVYIVYIVHVRPQQAAVVVMHGAMQIDEFLTDAHWDGNALRFADAEKRVRYEVRVGAARRAPR